MKIKSIKKYLKMFELTRPYTIAYRSRSDVQNIIVVVELENGTLGLGCASPSDQVTGESIHDAVEALSDQHLSALIGQDIDRLMDKSDSEMSRLQKTPAACAAVEMALYDAYAKMMNQPLVALLGQVHTCLPTSITIGIKNHEETLKEAHEYIDREFTHLKVKLGLSLKEDIGRLEALRKHFPSVTIRVDPNQGYDLSACLTLLEQTKALNIELIEQPMKVSDTKLLCDLNEGDKKKIALDESLLTVEDAIALSNDGACGIFNIKLMKCGGIILARKIAEIAKKSHIEVMWGCNDESIISISAALHAAFSCSATRYLDLDGSLDLMNDVVTGGFIIEKGMMRLTDAPGLGVTLREAVL